MKMILSAELSTNDWSTNTKETFRLYECLKSNGVSFEVAKGHYKGSNEISFVCSGLNEEQVHQVAYIAMQSYKQESVLVIDNEQCELRYANGRSENIGKWTEVSKDMVKRFEGFTSVEGRYFVAA